MSRRRSPLTDADWSAVEHFARHGCVSDAASRFNISRDRFYKALDRIAPMLRARTLRFHLTASASGASE